MAWYSDLLGTLSSTFSIGKGVNKTTLTSTATAARSLSLPNKAGTLATTSDVITDHNSLSNVQAAGTGVTNGHITAADQAIAGNKTFSGYMGIGATYGSNAALRITLNTMVGTDQVGIKNYINFNLGATASGTGYESDPTIDAGTSITELRHMSFADTRNSGTVAVGRYLHFSDPLKTYSSSFSAIRSSLSYGATRYFIAHTGTANSFHQGSWIVGSSNWDGVSALQVSGQTALSGKLLVGGSGSTYDFGGSAISPYLQVEGVTADATSISVTGHVNNNAPGRIIMAKSRGASAGSVTEVAQNDYLGMFMFNGADGTTMLHTAGIYAFVDGAVSTGVVPTSIRIVTAASGSSPVVRMEVSSTGKVTINTPSDGSSALVLDGDLAFAGSRRIKGDFSNGTHSLRTCFQSSTTNGYTSIMAAPNGAGAGGNFVGLCSSDVDNSPYVVIGYNSAGMPYIHTGAVGSGVTQPLNFMYAGTTVGKMYAGRWFFGFSPTDDGINTVQVNGTISAAAPAANAYNTQVPTTSWVRGREEWITKTGSYTAVAGDKILYDTSAGAGSLTLPATPTAGQVVKVLDSKSTFGTYGLTILRNGSTIEGLSEDMTCRNSGDYIELIYNGTTWRVI